MVNQKDDSKHQTDISRRKFLGQTAAAIGAIGFPYVVSSSAVGAGGSVPPSERIVIGSIGVGGQGTFNMVQLMNLPDTQIAAVCDVDQGSDGYLGGAWGGGWGKGRGGAIPAKKMAEEYYAKNRSNGSFKGVDAYGDFREIINRDDIDAVAISTPDHWHAITAMQAIKAGKHVYCEKPLTHSVYEARQLAKAAKKANVATQMGNQGHCGEGIRLIVEWIADGAIGQVHEVQCWTNRPVWPQGLDRPKETPPVPDSLDWDMYCGPAPIRPYHPAYHPFNWRGWWDFGTGVMGDMGCHIMDVPWWALHLQSPEAIEASSSPVNDETAPLASIIHQYYPKRGDMVPVKMSWYDGGLTPPRPRDLEPTRPLGDGTGNGLIFIGEKGKIKCGCYGASPRIFPESKMLAYDRPPKSIPRVKGPHENWIRGCRTGKATASSFEKAGPLTEAVLLSNIAIRTGNRLHWDSKNMKFTKIEGQNAGEEALAQANKYVNPPYRGDWKL